MTRCDDCARHVDLDLVCPHVDGRRLCSDCCGCDPDRGPLDRTVPEAELVIANAVAELRIALGHLWAGTDGRFVTGAELVETIADGLEAVLNRTETK